MGTGGKLEKNCWKPQQINDVFHSTWIVTNDDDNPNRLTVMKRNWRKATVRLDTSGELLIHLKWKRFSFITISKSSLDMSCNNNSALSTFSISKSSKFKIKTWSFNINCCDVYILFNSIRSSSTLKFETRAEGKLLMFCLRLRSK